MAKVFISYSHKDKEYVHKLAEALEKNGISAWLDDRIDYGDQWPQEIQEQLDACSAFIVVMTPRSYQSEWVQNELSRAKRKHKKIIPLLLDGDDFWLSVETTQHVDVRGGKLPPQRFFDQLSAAIQEPHSETTDHEIVETQISPEQETTSSYRDPRLDGTWVELPDENQIIKPARFYFSSPTLKFYPDNTLVTIENDSLEFTVQTDIEERRPFQAHTDANPHYIEFFKSKETAKPGMIYELLDQDRLRTEYYQWLRPIMFGENARIWKRSTEE